MLETVFSTSCHPPHLSTSPSSFTSSTPSSPYLSLGLSTSSLLSSSSSYSNTSSSYSSPRSPSMPPFTTFFYSPSSSAESEFPSFSGSDSGYDCTVTVSSSGSSLATVEMPSQDLTSTTLCPLYHLHGLVRPETWSEPRRFANSQNSGRRCSVPGDQLYKSSSSSLLEAPLHSNLQSSAQLFRRSLRYFMSLLLSLEMAH